MYVLVLFMLSLLTIHSVTLCPDQALQVIEALVFLRGSRRVDRHCRIYKDGVRPNFAPADSQCANHCQLRCISGRKPVLRREL